MSDVNRLDQMRIEWEAERRVLLKLKSLIDTELRDVEQRRKVFGEGGK